MHAWDEGVAFYTGSLEGAAPGGNSAGKLAYRLAEKRCAGLGICTLTLALALALTPYPDSNQVCQLRHVHRRGQD